MPSPTTNLAAELGDLLRPGVTQTTLAECSGLIGLELVKARSASDRTSDLAVGAHQLIREAATRVDGSDSGPAGILLGVVPATSGLKLTDRREQAAGLLHVSPDHFRKERESKLIASVAEELHALDSGYRLRHQHRLEGERPPHESRLQVDWLEQHRSYRRVWSPVEAMRNDLLVLLGYLRDGHDDHADIADRLCNIVWRYAQFQVELEAFVERDGGLWLLADADSEIAAADAIYRIGFHVPMGEADDSWLRLLLSRSEAGELEPFTAQLINAGSRRRELMANWMAWAEECSLDLEANDPRCEVHAWLAAADEFVRLIDDDWYRVADWYR